jgi:hypothetical protein
MDTDQFGARAKAWQEEYERRTNQPVDGIVSDGDLQHLGIPVPAAKPIIFTVEGHLSNMFVGPCAYTAQELEREGLAHCQPVGYDNVSLPFNNQSGVNELLRLLNSTVMDNGVPFPYGTPWELFIFSQGGIVGSKVFMQLRTSNHPRLKDLKAVLAFGNPYRQKDVIAPWVADPPKKGTQGISDVRMTDTPEYWREVARTGDLYAENPDSEVGLNRSAIYKIVAENSWAGGEAGMWQRVLDLAKNPADGLLDIAVAIAGGVRFVTNMAPHGTYDLGPCVDFARSRLQGG